MEDRSKEKTGKGRKFLSIEILRLSLLFTWLKKIINENMMHISAELSEKQIERIKEELDTIERIPGSDIITLVSKEQIKTRYWKVS